MGTFITRTLLPDRTAGIFTTGISTRSNNENITEMFTSRLNIGNSFITGKTQRRNSDFQIGNWDHTFQNCLRVLSLQNLGIYNFVTGTYISGILLLHQLTVVYFVWMFNSVQHNETDQTNIHFYVIHNTQNRTKNVNLVNLVRPITKDEERMLPLIVKKIVSSVATYGLNVSTSLRNLETK